jgi:hypothetical protein
MAAIFDTAKIERLIRDQGIQTVLVVDSGIMLDEPDFDKWRSGNENTLYVMPCTLDFELEHLKNQPDYQSNACLASDNYNSICSNGEINDGIFRPKVGWVISPPPPDRSLLSNELAKVDLLTRSLGKLNTQLLILKREIRQRVTGLPVVLVTRDRQVFNTLQLMDIQSHLFTAFPIKLDPAIQPAAAIPDWNAVLQKIQSEAERDRVSLSLTLLKKYAPPSWLVPAGGQPVLIAEGKGILYSPPGLRFNWTLLFEPWDFPAARLKAASLESGLESGQKPSSDRPVNQEWRPGRVHLDMDDGPDTLPAYLYQIVVRTILKCASPMAYIEDLPTLQGPISILKQFLIFEYAFQERRLHGDIHPEDYLEIENRLRDPDNLLNWAYYWLRERQSKAEEIDLSLRDLLSALHSCWNIGETVKLEVAAGDAEAK